MVDNNSNNGIPVSGDIIGSFSSDSLLYAHARARDIFVNAIASLTDVQDPRPYFITLYALTLISNDAIREDLVHSFQEQMNALPDYRSLEGIMVCISVWAAISEYMSVAAGTGKKEVIVGEVDSLSCEGMEEDGSKKKKKGKAKKNVETEDNIEIEVEFEPKLINGEYE